MTSLKFKEIMCFLYSCLIFISGVLLIGFSSVLIYKLFYHFKFVPGSSIGPFIVIFLLGFIHLSVTWLGFRGPSREHDFHIILFMIVALTLLIIECAVGIWSIILWDEADVESNQLMTESFNELIKNNDNKKDWAKLESKLQCCGLNGVQEYQEHKGIIPVSCCHNDISNGTCLTFESGCKLPFSRYLKHILIDGAIMGFCCCAFQAIGIFIFYKFFQELKVTRSARRERLEMQRRASQGVAPSSPQSNVSPPTATPKPGSATSA